MARLDEIAELLTEEIHSFDKSVSKLELLQKNLKNYKLEPDTSLVNKMLYEYHENQIQRQRKLHEMMSVVRNSLEKSQVIPRWQVKLFWAYSSLSLLGWGITIVFLLKS